MENDRLEQLRTMLAEEPSDLFIRYAIALELRSRGSMEEAVTALQGLLRDAPDHVPSYYQLALFQADLGSMEDAIATCERGMVQAGAVDDRKALAELKELRETLLDER